MPNLDPPVAALVEEEVRRHGVDLRLGATVGGILSTDDGLDAVIDGQIIGVDAVVVAAGVRPGQSIDAMAVVYMVTTLAWLLIALRFVNPTQIVTRAKQ